MKELLTAINSRRAVLFVGAGATLEGGGLTWKDLSEHLATECKIKPLSSAQETIDELCDYQKRRSEVYRIVQDRLAAVSAGRSLSDILSLPWLTIYTTNYDTAIEDYYWSRKELSPTVLTKAPKTVQFGIPGEIVIFKAMGSRTVAFGNQGEMILSGVDRARHRMEEAEMYHHLDGLVGATAVLAIGYSFQDGMLMEAVQAIRALRMKSSLMVYAVFRSGTENPLLDKLRRMDVKIVEMELNDLARKLLKGASATPIETHVDVRVAGKSFLLRASSIRDTLGAFDLVTDSECKKHIPIDEFLRGRTSPAGAYEARLQWLRTPMTSGRQILDAWMSHRVGTHIVINYSGRPGSGRTVASNDLLHYAVTRYKSIGLRTPQRSPRLNSMAASQLMGHIIDKGDSSVVENLVVLADEHSALEDVVDFLYEAEASGTLGKGIVVIRSGEEELATEKSHYPSIDIHNIRLEDTIPQSDVSPLSQYLSNLPAEVRPFRMTSDEIDHIVKREGSFIELMYSLVDPSRRSIREIVLDEFAELSPEAKSAISHLLVPSSVGTGVPITLLAKMHGKDIPAIYDLLDQCVKLVRIDEDGTRMPFVSLYHRRAAEILLGIPDIQKNIQSVLLEMVKRANLRGGSEHQLIVDLLVGSPGLTPPVDKWLDKEQIIELFNVARNNGASRLLLHHFGLRLRAAKQYDLGIEVLEEALDVLEDTSWQTERKEIIATTLAHLRWIRLKEQDPEYNYTTPALLEIRADLKRARLHIRWNPHSYGIESSILRDLAARAIGQRRMELLGEALGILHEGLGVSGGSNPYLVDEMKKVLDDSKGFGETDAEELDAKYGSGHGYYLLYEQARLSDDSAKADDLLAKALKSRTPCPPALRRAIDSELLVAEDPDYKKAKGYSDRLANLEADRRSRFSLNWMDHLQRVVCLVGSGNGKLAGGDLAEVRRFAPKSVPLLFPYFLRAGGRRKVFSGRIGEISSSTVGTIVHHDILGWSGTLYFNPIRGKVPTSFRSNDLVKFNVAFGVLGMSAWDVARL